MRLNNLTVVVRVVLLQLNKHLIVVGESCAVCRTPSGSTADCGHGRALDTRASLSLSLSVCLLAEPSGCRRASPLGVDSKMKLELARLGCPLKLPEWFRRHTHRGLRFQVRLARKGRWKINFSFSPLRQLDDDLC